MISSIQNYFNSSETPIICYKYIKLIPSTIFNFNKNVTDININSNTPDSCDCPNSNYLYPPEGHVLMSFLSLEFAILFLKILNIDFPLLLIPLNVVERSCLL